MPRDIAFLNSYALNECSFAKVNKKGTRRCL
jgi:hypothetical protein